MQDYHHVPTTVWVGGGGAGGRADQCRFIEYVIEQDWNNHGAGQ
jgi:hypothetical protein